MAASTILLVEGFDVADDDAKAISGGRWFALAGTNTAMVAGRFGGLAIQSTDTASGPTWNDTTLRTRLHLGFSLRIDELPLANRGSVVAFLNSASSRVCSLSFNPAGVMGLMLGNDLGVPVATGAAAFPVAGWRWVEIYVFATSTAGLDRVTVWVDGSLHLTWLGNFTVTGSILKTEFMSGNAGVSTIGLEATIDDLVVAEPAGVPDLWGPSRVYTFFPNSTYDEVGTWTLTGAASDHEAVNDVINGTAEAKYTAAETNLARLLFGHAGTFTNDPTTIHGVAVSIRGEADDVDGEWSVGGALQSGEDVEEDATLVDIDTSLLWVQSLWQTNPFGGAWSSTEIAAMKFGVTTVTTQPTSGIDFTGWTLNLDCGAPVLGPFPNNEGACDPTVFYSASGLGDFVKLTNSPSGFDTYIGVWIGEPYELEGGAYIGPVAAEYQIVVANPSSPPEAPGEITAVPLNVMGVFLEVFATIAGALVPGQPPNVTISFKVLPRV
jgi:hypothetical protein